MPNLIDRETNIESSGKVNYMPPRLQVGFLRSGGRPIDMLRISCTWGRRSDPLSGRPAFHYGVDIAIPRGTEVYSPGVGIGDSYGTVTQIQKDPNRPSGIYITVRFAGLAYTYMHLSEVNGALRVGDKIAPNSYLGRTGNTGKSTGDHLHLQIQTGTLASSQMARDPLPFLFLHNLQMGGVTWNKITKAQADLKGWKMDYRLVHSTNWGGAFNPNSEGNKIIIIDPNGINEQLGESNDISNQGMPSSGQDSVFYDRESAMKKVAKLFVPEATESSAKASGGGKSGIGDLDEKLLRGIWQITKCIIDGSVENRQVIDSSLSSLSGSFKSFFSKVCQSPFVEMFGDTYGSMYYWIVRKPPTDREGVNRLMNSAMVEIRPEDVLRTSLQFADGAEAYSWYQYLPTMEVIAQQRVSQFIPAVFFPAYADVWGSKPMVVQSNYYEYKNGKKRFAEKDNDAKTGYEDIVRTAIRDLKYIVESNACSPFLRKGTITLKGDRRIKVGTLVLLSGKSSEIFLVTGVSQSYSVSMGQVHRQTTINVSRGMLVDYVIGKQLEDGTTVSYFDLIDFGKKEDGSDFDIEKDLNSNNYDKYLSRWKVNMKVFEYFLKRRHVEL